MVGCDLLGVASCEVEVRAQKSPGKPLAGVPARFVHSVII